MEAKSDDHIRWLTRWYAEQCNGTWEHDYGVTIATLDNPGWIVKVELRGTALAGVPFEPVSCNLDAANDTPDARWHSCKVEGHSFEGAGGAHDLLTIVGVLRAWVESQAV